MQETPHTPQPQPDAQSARPRYLRRRVNGFWAAFKGVGYLFRTQEHAKVHLVAAVAVVAAGLYFEIERWEWAAITGCIALVWALEAVNTAIEALTDLAHPGYHPLAGHAKDVAAAAVLLAALGAAVVGGLVFVPRFWALWQQWQ